MMSRKIVTYIFLALMVLGRVSAQEETPFVTYDVPSQNLLKYNRFLINPTFSTVREDKSYINLLHRNQSVSFDDNNQAYFLSYSGRINDRTGLGLSLYTQREGTFSNFGVLANYAYGIKLSDKSNFTFGANVSYYNSGFDHNRANPVEDDPLLNGLQDSNLLSFQPGFNVSYGNFDFGLFAENLFDYNIKTNESVTEFKDKTYSGHLQYTHQFKSTSGLLEGGRLMPLARVRKVGQDDVVLGGSLILDLPKLGWLQGGYDSFYGAAAGIGFNLSKRLSLGYTMEKGLSSEFDNFGVTHEISFAYSFTPNLTEDRVMLEDDNQDQLVEKEAIPLDSITNRDKEIEDLKKKLAENDAILEELMFRQDSLEANRQKDLERRFDLVMRMVRQETNGERPDLEKRAQEIFLAGKDSVGNNTTPTLALGNRPSKNITSGTKRAEQTRDRVAEQQRDADEFAQAANSQHVKNRRFTNLEGVDDGYYTVVNVYKNDLYLHKFLDELKAQGVEADYFTNPNNGLKYVYLKKYDHWKQALEAYKSGADGSYSGQMWVMNVDNGQGPASNGNSAYDRSKDYNNQLLQKNVVARDNVPQTGAPSSQMVSLDGIGEGFYLIANVFSNPSNANRFVRLLNSQGLNASYFINPRNHYRYVYLKKHETWNNALISYYSKLNNAYQDKIWIMRVKPKHHTT